MGTVLNVARFPLLPLSSEYGTYKRVHSTAGRSRRTRCGRGFEFYIKSLLIETVSGNGFYHTILEY